MNYDSEFKEIGKKMPYSVPDGYFDGITETTLDKIRQREKIRRKKILIWRSMAIAASLTALITTAYLLINFLQPKKTGRPLRILLPNLRQKFRMKFPDR
jgi:hypothetical protein